MRTNIIAEISSNHMGDMEVAKDMIRIAAENGADFVKFQSFKAETLRPDWPDQEWYIKTELSKEQHYLLIEECQKNGVQFLTTCFDRTAIPFLSSLNLTHIKVASTDLASYTMLEELREKFDYMIVSTGMSYREEIEKASKILRTGNFAFLHCVSIYPTPIEKLNIKKMDWLRNFTNDVGLSDHSIGVEGAMIAAARGAAFIEKHFTLNRDWPGKDHKISILPEQLKQLTDFRDAVEKADSNLSFDLSSGEVDVRDRFVGRWGDNK